MLDIWYLRELMGGVPGASVLQTLPVAYVACDDRLRITGWNQAAERLFGHLADEVRGEALAKLVRPRPSLDPSPNGPDTCVTSCVTGVGRTIRCEWRSTPLYGTRGELTGFSFVIEDIASREALELELRQTVATLDDLQRVARIGAWRWDVINDDVTWSDECYRILGLEGDAALTFRDRIHPDDIDRMWAAMRQCLDDHQPFQISWRAFHAEGSLRHMLSHAKLELDVLGRPQRMFGTLQDVTERTLARQAVTDELAAMVRLQEVSTRLVGAEDASSLLQDICDAAIAITSADMGNIRLAEPETKVLRVVAMRGMDPELLAQFATVPFTGENRDRIIVEDFEKYYEGMFLGISRGHGIRCVQTTPLVSRSGNVVGVLSTHYRTRRPAERDLRILDLLARQAADWIERHAAQAEREKLLGREREARAQAEHAVQVKDQFLATLSHELRTPLTVIVAWAELLQLDPDDTEQVSQGIELIRRNALAQAQLVGDLLDLSRIVSGKMRLEVRTVDLVELAHDVIAAVTPAYDGKNVSLEFVLQPEHAYVQGDPGRLRQILWNLLSNAAKFTPANGRVDLVIAQVELEFEVRVSDTGVGIAEDFLPHVFERFRQADASRSREHGGLGIGLALVKELAEAHGGRVDAYSDGPGKGSTFVVTLPQSVIAPVKPRLRTEPPSRGARPVLDGVRVLLVDDDEDTLDVIERILQTHGAHVTGATNAEDALRALEYDRFDVLLSDIGLPRVDGFELLAEVRRRRVETPAAAITAFARSEDRTRVLGAGFDAYVSKPVEAADLVATVVSLSARPG